MTDRAGVFLAARDGWWRQSGAARLGLLALVAAALSACAPSMSGLKESVFGPDEPDKAMTAPLEAAHTESRDPLLAYLATATANSVGTVQDPATGTRMRVLAMPSYQAASGLICRRYRVEATVADPGHEGLVCQEANGAWKRNPIMANPSF